MKRPRIALLFSTFPALSETFLQREVKAFLETGNDVTIYSLWGGGESFSGCPIIRFDKWKLLRLIRVLPGEFWRHRRAYRDIIGELFRRPFPSVLNLAENLLGFGFALAFAEEFRRQQPTHIHAVWATMPASAAWVLKELTGIPFSTGAHAYDLFMDGGDWFLKEKIREAQWVRTSTEAGRRRLLALGCPSTKIRLVRRGLVESLHCRPLRRPRHVLRLLSVGRLVRKKGFLRQMILYRQLKDRGIAFEARIIGDGPLREEVMAARSRLGLADTVALTGALPFEKVIEEMGWADLLVHTGVVDRSGDRDGLPNVILEAMAAGVIVAATPVGGVREAVTHGETGFCLSLDRPDEWEEALITLRDDDLVAEQIRLAARAWVETYFDARVNVRVLLRYMKDSRDGKRTAV